MAQAAMSVARLGPHFRREAAFLCRLPLPDAAVSARLMSLVIMSLLALGLAPYVLGGAGQLLLRMSWSATPTSRLQGMMTGALRLLLTGFPCGVAPSSQLTQPWSPLGRQLGRPAAAVTPMPVQPLQRLAGLRNAPTLNSGVRHGVAWSCWASRFADAGVPTSSGCWPEHGRAMLLRCSASLPSWGDGRGC